MNDISRLKEEADIAMVVAYLGIPTYKRGSATFLLCPNPEHDDHKPTNCYYKDGWNNVYCRACGCSTNAINLIMQETGKDFSDAADLLWELEGRPEWYKQEKKKKNPVPDFRISREEAEQIGIHFPGRLLAPVAYALTIHKSQGSEYPVVVIPIYDFIPMLTTRNLIYTGVTRAKKAILLIGSYKKMQLIIRNMNQNKRYSNLKDELNKLQKGEK